MNMKKIISLFIVMVFMSSFVSATIHPVVGNVIKDGQGVSDAYVVVNCNNNVKTTTSISGGAYAVEYTDTECPDDTDVYVEATKDSYYGAVSGKMHDFTVLTIAIIDVFIYKVIEVLEAPIKLFRRITIPNLRINEVVAAGDYLDLNTEIENAGNRDMLDVRITAVVADLGLRKSVKISKLGEGKDKSKELKLFIPADTEPGVYDVRITVSNDYVKRVNHREFRVA